MQKSRIVAFSALVLTFSLTFAEAALAKKPKHRRECPPPETFRKEILNCGHNVLTVQKAQVCGRSLMNSSIATGKALHAVMMEMEASLQQGQSQSMDDTKKRLAMAITALTAQIQDLEFHTDIVASYPTAMIDLPGGVDDDTSAECFNTAFHSIQKFVDQLDDEIINSKRALEQATFLMAQTGDREDNFESLSSTVAPTHPAAAGTPVDLGNRRARDSDISGTEDRNPRR
jgi:hypothetical protein